MDDKQQQRIVDNALETINSVGKSFSEMRVTMKAMNDNFILHKEISLDTNKMVKGVIIWTIKAVVLALIILAGAKALLNFL